MLKVVLGILVGAGLLVSAFIFFSQPASNANLSFSPSPTPQISFLPTSAVVPTEAMQIDIAKKYNALLKTTVGDMDIELTATATPITVNNFVTLAKKGFYNGTIFHRTIAGFMIQGGDPQGTGRGGPGYTFNDEPFTGEYTRGTVAMANSGPNTNGSQFFIMHKDQSLPHNYVIFGHLLSGFDTLDKIATAPAKANVSMPGENSVPLNPVKIVSVSIEEK